MIREVLLVSSEFPLPFYVSVKIIVFGAVPVGRPYPGTVTVSGLSWLPREELNNRIAVFPIFHSFY